MVGRLKISYMFVRPQFSFFAKELILNLCFRTCSSIRLPICIESAMNYPSNSPYFNFFVELPLLLNLSHTHYYLYHRLQRAGI